MTDVLVRGAEQLWTGQRGAAMRASGGTDIRVRGGVISAIGTLAPDPGERVIDAAGCVIYPGWVNTHHHLFQSLLKGIPAGINLGLVPWLAAVPVAYRRHFDTEHALRIAARVGLVELLLSGCSTVADHQYHYWPGMPFDASAAVFDEAERLGLRLVLCRGGQTQLRALTDQAAPPQVMPETLDAFLASVARDAQRFHDPGPMAMRRVASAITTPNWSCRPDELKLMAREARRLGIRLHSHLSETYDYVRWAREVHDCTPLQFVEKHEWVGPDVWYAHMVHLDDDEIRLCADTGTGIAHCPQSNGRLGSGIARVPEMLAAGVPVSLAVDGAASNEAADMQSEAHACWLMHRADPRAGERQRFTMRRAASCARPPSRSTGWRRRRHDGRRRGAHRHRRRRARARPGRRGHAGRWAWRPTSLCTTWTTRATSACTTSASALSPAAAAPGCARCWWPAAWWPRTTRSPALDLAELRHEAQALVSRMLNP